MFSKANRTRLLYMALELRELAQNNTPTMLPILVLMADFIEALVDQPGDLVERANELRAGAETVVEASRGPG